jgi:hypothetical protein
VENAGLLVVDPDSGTGMKGSGSIPEHSRARSVSAPFCGGCTPHLAGAVS